MTCPRLTFAALLVYVGCAYEPLSLPVAGSFDGGASDADTTGSDGRWGDPISGDSAQGGGTGDDGSGDDASRGDAAGNFSCFNRMVTVDSAASTDVLDVPILIKLTGAMVQDGFDPAGRDLRITDPLGEPLFYEIEAYGDLGAAIWVKVFVLPAGVSNLWIHGGSIAAAAGYSSAPDVWSNGYEAVWHLDGGFDAAVGPALARSVGAVDWGPGTIARGAVFAAGSYIDIGVDLPLLRFVPAHTLSLWIRPASAPAANQVWSLLSIGNGRSPRRADPRARIQFLSDQTVNAIIRDDDRQAAVEVQGAIPLPTGTWTHVAVTTHFNNDVVTIFQNDTNAAQVSFDFKYNETSDTAALGGAIGAADDGSEAGFVGTIDEVRIANVDRNADWNTVQYQSMMHTLIVDVGPPTLEPCP